MRPFITQESTQKVDHITLPKAGATVFVKGQFVSLESNVAVHMDAAAEDATFAGVVWMGADATVTEVRVLMSGQVEIDLAGAATADLGDGFAYNAGDTSTDYSIVADGAANTIMHAAKQYDSNVTRLRANFDVRGLGKLYGVSA